MDAMYIRDLRIPCVIGVNAWERRIHQVVTVDLDIEIDLRKPGQSDSLNDALDYRILCDRIVQAVKGSGCCLIEALAEKIAQVCLEDERIQGVDVHVGKPGAVHNAGVVGVRVSRRKA